MINRLFVTPEGEIALQQIAESTILDVGVMPDLQDMEPGLYDEDGNMIEREEVPPQLMVAWLARKRSK